MISGAFSDDPTFIDEADRRIADARRAFATADQVVADTNQRAAVDTAHAGFEQWVAAVHDEFAVFQTGDRPPGRVPVRELPRLSIRPHEGIVEDPA